MTVFSLANRKECFTNAEALRKFIQELQEDIDKSEPVVVLGDEGQVIGTILSTTLTQQVLAQRILKGLQETPGLIDEIQDRLEHDDIVD